MPSFHIFVVCLHSLTIQKPQYHSPWQFVSPPFCFAWPPVVTPLQVSWKKLAGRQSNQLVGVVSKLDEQVHSSVAPISLAQKSIKMMDAAKQRRKKHYRLESEEKPTFPFQQRNFYNHIMENKEIVKTLSLLSTCTQNVKTVSLHDPTIIKYVEVWMDVCFSFTEKRLDLTLWKACSNLTPTEEKNLLTP